MIPFIHFSVFPSIAPMATINSSGNVVQLNEVVVAMVPHVEYSHFNQLFTIARFIASHNIPVHFLSLPEQSRTFKQRIQGGLELPNIYFDDLLLQPTETKDCGSDAPPMTVLMIRLIRPIYQTCLELSTSAKRMVLILDYPISASMGEWLSFPNTELYVFNPIPAFTRYSWLRQSTDIVDNDHDKLLEQLQDEFPTVESSFGPDIALALSVATGREWKLNAGGLINSCRELEGKYLELLANTSTVKKRLLAIGPLHMLLESQNSSKKTHHECLEFLNKQDVNSVIFVSFGTNATLSQEQVNEIALGLEQSNHKFIWVLREADKRMEIDNDEEKKERIELPEGFEERVEGRGMVVRNWVPQLEILGHPSTGGFLSHCGWNSCLESISNGVPIAAWPMRADQPYNAVLLINVLNVAIYVRSWAGREELVTAAPIEKVVKTLMGTPEGEEMRQRAVELGNKIKSSVGHGGNARKEMESFISYISG